MQDAIIKGNGNSRYLKTVAAALSLYPTYEDFLQALVAGNFPIDLNGINEAGWTQLGTPLNKANLLPDTLATSLGLPTTATVAEALKNLYTIPGGKGVLMVHCTDVNGDPVSGCVVTVGTSVTASNVFGFAKLELDGGTYSGTVRAPIDYGAVSSSFSGVVIKAGEITAIERSITDTLNGAKQIDITTSMTAAFSSRVVSADAFGVGGGGSGGCSTPAANSLSNARGNATGGAGGYTKTVKNIDRNLFKITIGAGGSPAKLSNKYQMKNGEPGGATEIKTVGDTVLLSAPGGDGGTADQSGYGRAGANGGSGSAAAANTSTSGRSSGSDGNDGSDATTSQSVTVYGGKGQGTTTRAFEESTAELFAGAGGTVTVQNNSKYVVPPGTGGGAAVGNTNIATGHNGNASPGSTRGSGGGGYAATSTGSNTDIINVASGAGADGLIRFRWEVA